MLTKAHNSTVSGAVNMFDELKLGFRFGAALDVDAVSLYFFLDRLPTQDVCMVF